jgi:hypothetical protein
MAGPGDLHVVAEELLAAAVDSLDDGAVLSGLLGAPERRFVSPGIPVWDCCDMLTVDVRAIGELPTGPQGGVGSAGKRHIYGRINLATLVTTITRCLPAGETVGKRYTPPTIAQQEAAAEQINADGWALWNGILNRLTAGLLWEKCLEVHWETMAAVAPSGGCAGWTLSLRVMLDGYSEDLGS